MNEEDRLVVSQDEFMDIMHPVICYTCGENVASKVELYEALRDATSAKEALDEMGIDNPCTRQLFVTGGSNVIITSPCAACVKGEACTSHDIWHPTQLATLADSTDVHVASPQETLQASREVSLTASEEGELPPSEHGASQSDAGYVPPKYRLATPFQSDHLPKVNVILNEPKSFEIPTHLSEYDKYASTIVLDSNDKVKEIMGQVYKIAF